MKNAKRPYRGELRDEGYRAQVAGLVAYAEDFSKLSFGGTRPNKRRFRLDTAGKPIILH